MEYEKEPGKKPYKSTFNNALWSLREMIKDAPVTLFLMVLEVPPAVFLAWSEVRLPALVVGEVTNGGAAAGMTDRAVIAASEMTNAAAAAGGIMNRAALTVGLFLLAVLLATILRDACGAVLNVLLQRYRYIQGARLDRKALECFYQTFEKKETRDLHGRAELASWMMNGRQPLSDVPRHSLALLENLMCYVLFGTVISFVTPWLVVFLTLAPAVNVLCARAYRTWEYSTRAQRADNERRLDYIVSRPADYAAWKDIRIYGMAGWFKEIFGELLSTDIMWLRRMTFRQFLSRLADLAVILLRDGAAYAVLISQAVRGVVTAEEFVLYFGAVSAFAGFVGNIVNEWNAIGNAGLYICDFREFLDLPDMQPEGTKTMEDRPDGAPEIVFDHVSFRYAGAEQDTIHDLSVVIRAGEKIALVGMNGAGKTTLVKLLTGLYAPAAGQIRIDGVPAADFRREEYYKLFAPVFQDVRLGPFSIAETVTGMPKGGGDEAKAEACLRRAGLGEKIGALPKGIHTMMDKLLDPDGTDLSGGEKQKLMLARALYKDAPVLVLDEPTAALDPIAENEIYQQYGAMTAGKTSIFISHRLASTRFCDRIFFLENGRIAEQGTHSELIELGGAYSRLYEIQSCWYREDYKGGETE